MVKLILATTSDYKKKVFGYLGIQFIAEDSKVDESVLPRDDPKKLVLGLSRLKAKAVAQRHQEGIILGFDSIGYFNGKILEKQKNFEDTKKRLKMLSGKNHWTFTGICAINVKTGKIIQKVVSTKVTMRKLTDKEINEYVNSDKNILKYCLGYDPELSVSSSFALKITGSYNNLLNGMPIEVIPEILQKIQ